VVYRYRRDTPLPVKIVSACHGLISPPASGGNEHFPLILVNYPSNSLSRHPCVKPLSSDSSTK